jgi:trans-aconitate methyltransferase
MTAVASKLTVFDAYGAIADAGVTMTEAAGRYAAQADDERRIVLDVAEKLALAPSHRLLDIGCGPGALAIPLSFLVKHTTGLDHANTIARCRTRFNDPALTWTAGRFPDEAPEGPFDRILSYSVLHCLPSREAAIAFIDRAIELLAPEGRLLIGDLPNSDRRKRFTESEAGKRFDEEWKARLATTPVTEAGANAHEMLRASSSVGMFDDVFLTSLVALYRTRGLHAFLLPQPPELPFGRTREDLLIVRP